MTTQVAIAESARLREAQAQPARTVGSPMAGAQSADRRKLLSIVVPVYREAANLEELWTRLRDVLAGLTAYNWEVVFVNDGSPDDSLVHLAALADADSRCRVIDLSRNFGKEVALTAGLDAARGDGVIFMDADMQHPPDFIPQMVSAWEAGAEVVVTVRRSCEAEPLARRLGSSLFHWVMKNFAEVELLSKTTDFRLLDRKVVEAVRQIGERERLFRGLVDWLGFRRAVLEFDAPKRPGDQKTSFTYRRLGGLAMTSFLSHSSLPLKLVGVLGGSVTLGSGALLTWMLVAERLVDKRFYYTPLAQVLVANTLLIGIVLTALGVVAIYLARVYREVLQRPLYAVRQKLNIDDGSDRGGRG